MAPYEPAAHLEHYKNVSHTSLQALAKLQSQNSEGSKDEIVARYLARDARTGKWPEMYYQSSTLAEGTAPAEATEKQGSASEESEEWDVVTSRKHTKAARTEKVEAIPEDVEEEPVVTEEPVPSETEDSMVVEMEGEYETVYPLHEIIHDARVFEKSNAVPIQQLAEEWDAYMSASKSAPKATATGSQGTSGNSSKSASTGATTPVDLEKPKRMSWADKVSDAAEEAASEKAEETRIEEHEYVPVQEDVSVCEKEPVDEAPVLEETPVEKQGDAPIPGAETMEVPVPEETQVQVEGPTKKKKRKRGKKGGKKANKSKATQATGGSLADTAVHNTVSAKPSEDLPAASPPVEVAPVEVSLETTQAGEGAEEDAVVPSADDSNVSGKAPGTIDYDGGNGEDLPFGDAPTEVDARVDESHKPEATQPDDSDAAPAVVVQPHAEQPVEDEQEEDLPEPEVAPVLPGTSVCVEAPEMEEALEQKQEPVTFFPPAAPSPAPASPFASVPASPASSQAYKKGNKGKQTKPVSLPNAGKPGYQLLASEATMPGDEPFGVDTAPQDSDAQENENKSSPVSTKKQRKRGKKGGKKAKKAKTVQTDDAHLTKMRAMQAGISAMGLALFAAVLGIWTKR